MEHSPKESAVAQTQLLGLVTGGWIHGTEKLAESM